MIWYSIGKGRRHGFKPSAPHHLLTAAKEAGLDLYHRTNGALGLAERVEITLYQSATSKAIGRFNVEIDSFEPEFYAVRIEEES